MIVAISGAGANAAALASVLSPPTLLAKAFGLSVVGDVVAFALGTVFTSLFGGINAGAKAKTAPPPTANQAKR